MGLRIAGIVVDIDTSWLSAPVATFVDKAVLLLSIAVVIALVGVVAELVSRRSRVPGLVLIQLLGVVAVVAMTRRDAGQT